LIRYLYVSMFLITALFSAWSAEASPQIVRQCQKDLHSAKTTTDFSKLSSDCLEYMSRSGDIRRALLRATNSKCTHRRIRDLTRSAKELRQERKKQDNNKAILSAAEKYRKNARGRSKMFSSCYKTMIDTLGVSGGGSIPVVKF